MRGDDGLDWLAADPAIANAATLTHHQLGLEVFWLEYGDALARGGVEGLADTYAAILALRDHCVGFLAAFRASLGLPPVRRAS